MENLYSQAFKALNLLEEEDFELTSDEMSELKDFLLDDSQDEISVIDPEADSEEEVKDSYIGKAILECSICHTMIYKDPSEIVYDEDSDLVNVDEECPYCYSTDGYKLVGQVAPFEPETEYDVTVEPKEESEENEDSEENTEENELEESLENLEIETEHDTIHVQAEEKEPIEGETIVPPTEEFVDAVKENESEPEFASGEPDAQSQEIPNEDTEEEDEVEVDDFDTEAFEDLGESFLKRNYSNVKSFSATKVTEDKNCVIVEGLITFDSGNVKKTEFKFTPDVATKSGKVKFFGENLQINNGKKSFRLFGNVSNGTFISESLNYNFVTKDNGKSVRISGTEKLSESYKNRNLKEDASQEELDLPKNLIVDILDLEYVDFDEEEPEVAINDYLNDTYGFPVNTYDWEMLEDNDSIYISNIDWNTQDEDLDESCHGKKKNVKKTE